MIEPEGIQIQVSRGHLRWFGSQSDWLSIPLAPDTDTLLVEARQPLPHEWAVWLLNATLIGFSPALLLSAVGFTLEAILDGPFWIIVFVPASVSLFLTMNVIIRVSASDLSGTSALYVNSSHDVAARFYGSSPDSLERIAADIERGKGDPEFVGHVRTTSSPGIAVTGYASAEAKQAAEYWQSSNGVLMFLAGLVPYTQNLGLVLLLVAAPSWLDWSKATVLAVGGLSVLIVCSCTPNQWRSIKPIISAVSWWLFPIYTRMRRGDLFRDRLGRWSGNRLVGAPINLAGEIVHRLGLNPTVLTFLGAAFSEWASTSGAFISWPAWVRTPGWWLLANLVCITAIALAYPAQQFGKTIGTVAIAGQDRAARMLRRRFILYLRPFTSDLRLSETPSSYSGAEGGEGFLPLATLYPSRTTEEVIVNDLKHGLGVRRVVAVGDGRSRDLPPGASRFYIHHLREDWIEVVGEFVRRATAVVIVASPGEGTELEFVTAAKNPDLTKLKILILDPHAYAEFRDNVIREYGISFSLLLPKWSAPLKGHQLPYPIRAIVGYTRSRNSYVDELLFWADAYPYRDITGDENLALPKRDLKLARDGMRWKLLKLFTIRRALKTVLGPHGNHSALRPDYRG